MLRKDPKPSPHVTSIPQPQGLERSGFLQIAGKTGSQAPGLGSSQV